MGGKCDSIEWNDIVNEFACQPNGNSIGSIIRTLCLAASVYLIWQERNSRIFRSEYRDWEELFKVGCETVKVRLLSLKMKPSDAVFKAHVDWDVDFKIMTNGIVKS